MNSLKSYLRHILPSSHGSRKSNSRRKKEEKQSVKSGQGEGREGPVKSASTSHMKQDSHGLKSRSASMGHDCHGRKGRSASMGQDCHGHKARSASMGHTSHGHKLKSASGCHTGQDCRRHQARSACDLDEDCDRRQVKSASTCYLDNDCDRHQVRLDSTCYLDDDCDGHQVRSASTCAMDEDCDQHQLKAASTCYLDQDFHAHQMRSASTSHMDQDYNGHLQTWASPRLLPSSSAKELSSHHTQDGSRQTPPRGGPGTPDWECTRTPPPSKPPRKDRVFCVELTMKVGEEDVGLEVEVVPLGTGSGGRHAAGEVPRDLQASGGRRSGVPLPSSSPTLQQGSGLPPSTPLCAVRVVVVREGGAAEREGRVRVKDEVVEVNGKTLLRESEDTAR
ncbi:hypothetical protein ACOMHN_002984 [Nucella lapillus]